VVSEHDLGQLWATLLNDHFEFCVAAFCTLRIVWYWGVLFLCGLRPSSPVVCGPLVATIVSFPSRGDLGWAHLLAAHSSEAAYANGWSFSSFPEVVSLFWSCFHFVVLSYCF
jgi:hypothetical protein